ncbi:hypothetical protein J3Q64DRAFT_1465536 [Phycomyces blakesleeanus]|uniref:Proteasome assembly chaperone 4 n=1 Tax=Phycomyces blakesleeanus TaxID=4837 RepID=A0ABR3B2S4_PHYBL
MTEEVEPRFLIHQATHLFVTEPVFFQLVQMNNSMLVWAGKKSGKLNDLSVAVPSFGNHTSPSATTILGQDVSESGRNMARRLATTMIINANANIIHTCTYIHTYICLCAGDFLMVPVVVALKYKQQFYVSLDTGSQDPMMNVFIEKKLTEMIKMVLT